MNVKKIVIILIGIHSLTACTYMEELSEKQEIERLKSFEKKCEKIGYKKETESMRNCILEFEKSYQFEHKVFMNELNTRNHIIYY